MYNGEEYSFSYTQFISGVKPDEHGMHKGKLGKRIRHGDSRGYLEGKSEIYQHFLPEC